MTRSPSGWPGRGGPRSRLPAKPRFPRPRFARTGPASWRAHATPEDRLISGGYRQYVILGAGLDSFAWRRADLIGWLRLIEVDRPASQARKLARIAELGLPVRDGHLFAAVDFEAGSLRDGLDRAGLDWSAAGLLFLARRDGIPHC